MTPEERAVIEAAYRVSALADDPGRLFGDALVELDAAIVVHDRVSESDWWQGPKPALDIRPRRTEPRYDPDHIHPPDYDHAGDTERTGHVHAPPPRLDCYALPDDIPDEEADAFLRALESDR